MRERNTASVLSPSSMSRMSWNSSRRTQVLRLLVCARRTSSTESSVAGSAAIRASMVTVGAPEEGSMETVGRRWASMRTVFVIQLSVFSRRARAATSLRQTSAWSRTQRKSAWKRAMFFKCRTVSRTRDVFPVLRSPCITTFCPDSMREASSLSSAGRGQKKSPLTVHPYLNGFIAASLSLVVVLNGVVPKGVVPFGTTWIV